MILAKYDYEKLADHISDDLIKNNKPLNESIKVVSIEMKLNPEQIKRLAEAANIKSYNKMYDNSEDKTFTFELGDSKKIIDDVYSDGHESGKEQKTEIKNMPPVQFDAEINPKRPQRDLEILGDDDELEVSKNTQTSEDSSSDHFIDALKVPRKDYSYSENIIEEKDEDNDDKKKNKMTNGEIEEKEIASTEEMEDEDEGDKLRKQASMMDSCIGNKELEEELSNRLVLLEDRINDDVVKTASLFLGYNKVSKFEELVKTAAAIFPRNKELFDTLEMVRNRAGISSDADVRPGFPKFASAKCSGIEQLDSLIDTYTTYLKTKKAYEYVTRK